MIGIIAFNDLHVCPFICKYTEILDKHEVKYELIYWNRSQIKFEDEDYGFKGNVISYDKYLDTYQLFNKKIGEFLCYTRFLYKTINDRKYDKLIILTSQTAVPLSFLLNGKYKNRYIYDYRDITKEAKSVTYKKLIIKLINSAKYVTFSSMGFVDFLKLEQKDKYIIAHNSRNAQYKNTTMNIRKAFPICLSYWGMVRQIEFNKRVCDLFGNDSRFVLYFHGDGYYQELDDYCKKKDYANIHFTGRYNFRTDIDRFVEKTDILNCLYENDINTKPTLAVKFYDSLKYRIPLLVSKGSYLASYVKNAPFAKSVDLNDETLDEIVEWYMNMDCENLLDSYQKYQDIVQEEDKIFETTLLDFVAEID